MIRRGGGNGDGNGYSLGAWIAMALLLGACAKLDKVDAPAPAAPALAQCPAPIPCPACAACPAPKLEPPVAKVPVLEAVGFDALPGWAGDDVAAAWSAFLASCNAMRFQPAWRNACAEAARLSSTGVPDAAHVRAYFETNFIAYRAATPEGSTQGLATGYYEPLLRGSRTRRAPFLHALYAPPDDLLVIDLASTNPDLKNMRLRGRIEGRRVVPYWSRAEIERGMAPVSGKEIVWVDDSIEAFFLEVQGSGRIRLDSGDMLRLN